MSLLNLNIGSKMKIGDLVGVDSCYIPSRKESVSIIIGFDRETDPILFPLIKGAKVFAGDPTPVAFYAEDIRNYESEFCSKD